MSANKPSQAKQRTEVLPAELVRPGVTEIIRAAFPDWSPEAFICYDDLNRFRTQYVQDALEEERGELCDRYDGRTVF